MDETKTKTTQRIDVRFGVDVDLVALEAAKKKLDNVRPGSVEHSVVFDGIKALHTYFIGRLDGECAAYMNIAKEQARQLFGM